MTRVKIWCKQKKIILDKINLKKVLRPNLWFLIVLGIDSLKESVKIKNGVNKK